MSGGSDMLVCLQQLLQQLEAAQGGEDPEARARLDLLRQQLGLLEEAKERAAAAAAEANPAAVTVTAASLSAGLSSDAAMLRQMDGLEARLAGLEDLLAHLDDGSKAVLMQSAGGWLGKLQAEEEGGADQAGNEAQQGQAAPGGSRGS